MHCSVWRFRGDPDTLERGYRALMERVPETNHVLHAAARTPDGLLIFAEHGLEAGDVEDFPVVLAFARRTELTDENWGTAASVP